MCAWISQVFQYKKKICIIHKKINNWKSICITISVYSFKTVRSELWNTNLILVTVILLLLIVYYHWNDYYIFYIEYRIYVMKIFLRHISKMISIVQYLNKVTLSDVTSILLFLYSWSFSHTEICIVNKDKNIFKLWLIIIILIK